MLDPAERVRFEQIVFTHLDAAFNLARWILGSGAGVEDVTQEAMLRARCSFGSFPGVDTRAWLLRIVHNTCYTCLEKKRSKNLADEFNEELYLGSCATLESIAIAEKDRECFIQALEMLPPHVREVIVLREMEGCSYKEIAAITSIPVGTVMSSLSHARHRLCSALTKAVRAEPNLEL